MTPLRAFVAIAAAVTLSVTTAYGATGLKDAGKPGFSLTGPQKSRRKADLTERTIRDNIENQQRILELLESTTPEYPEMLVALADFYWDLSEVFGRKAHGDELEQAIFDADNAKQKDRLAELQAEQQRHFKEQRVFQVKTVEKYKEVARRFPRTEKIDEIRYYLGFHLSSMGRREEGVDSFKDLIQKNPRSEYVPDALVNIGEHYFDLNEYEDALDLYAKAESYTESGVRPYAIYKQSWCHYNMGNYEYALDRLITVIKLTEARHKAGVIGAIDLMAEAQRELVFAYSKVGKPSAAIAFFRRWVPERFLEIASKLADIYSEQTDYRKSNRLLRTLMKEARKPQGDGRDLSYMVVRFQRQIVDNAHRQVDKAATVTEIQQLIKEFLALGDRGPADFLKQERAEVDRLILGIATGYHAEYKSTKAAKTLEYTQLLYDEYLRLFPDGDNAYAINFNNALLMLMTGKHAKAAQAFERVIAMKPAGKYADEAAERAAIAYLKGVIIRNQDVKVEAEEDIRRRQLEPDELKFVRAVDRWMAIVAKRGVSKDTRENIAPARFASAKIFYNANQFEEAAKRFATFVEKHADHPFWEDGARHVLSSYNLAHDVDSLRKFAELYRKDDRLMATPLADDVQRIRNEFNFLDCFKHERKGNHRAAAECFVGYSEEFPGADRAPAAIYNAGLNFFKAKRIHKAIEMQQHLIGRYPTNELAPKAFYSIGDIFRETTDYEQAAYVYEEFVHTYPKHKLANKALRYASIFRKTLGQYNEAVADLYVYLKRFPDPETDPRVHLDIILTREKSVKYARAITAARKHMRQYRRAPAGNRLQVLTITGRCWKKLKQPKKAKAKFREAVRLYESLDPAERDSLDLASVSAVAEAHFKIGEVLLRKARWILLRGTEKQMERQIRQKLQLMNESKKLYETVISYGHPGWTIAAYTQLGFSFRDLADAVENSAVPKRLKGIPGAADEYLGLMSEKAVPIRNKALESYRKALEIARETRWFNEYSERAEQAIAQLDLTDISIKEFRIRPDRTGANTGLPSFKKEVR